MTHADTGLHAALLWQQTAGYNAAKADRQTAPHNCLLQPIIGCATTEFNQSINVTSVAMNFMENSCQPFKLNLWCQLKYLLCLPGWLDTRLVVCAQDILRAQ
jgi:hypothetical protein